MNLLVANGTVLPRRCISCGLETDDLSLVEVIYYQPRTTLQVAQASEPVEGTCFLGGLAGPAEEAFTADHVICARASAFISLREMARKERIRVRYRAAAKIGAVLFVAALVVMVKTSEPWNMLAGLLLLSCIIFVPIALAMAVEKAKYVSFGSTPVPIEGGVGIQLLGLPASFGTEAVAQQPVKRIWITRTSVFWAVLIVIALIAFALE